MRAALGLSYVPTGLSRQRRWQSCVSLHAMHSLTVVAMQDISVRDLMPVTHNHASFEGNSLDQDNCQLFAHRYSTSIRIETSSLVLSHLYSSQSQVHVCVVP